MEGPTPVSALIHAATMVTAGVFLIIKCSALFEFSYSTLFIISVWGAITSIFAATSGLFLSDIKKVIAYSTCSQLGYMVLICGFSSYNLSLFHLMNHAISKAALFLCAGAIIHSLSNEQDMRRMGGLLKLLPISYITMFVASLAIIGFPFLTGFFSKDIIFEIVFNSYGTLNIFIYWIISITAIFTTIYSFRILYLVFIAAPNSFRFYIVSIHESSFLISLALSILVIGSIFSGFLFKDLLIGFGNLFLLTTISTNLQIINLYDSEFLPTIIKLIPLFLGFGGIFLLTLGLKFWKNYLFFYTKTGNIILNFLINKWYFDYIYNFYINLKIFKNIKPLFYKNLDKGLFEFFGPFGFWNLIKVIQKNLIKVQTGSISLYLFIYGFTFFVIIYLIKIDILFNFFLITWFFDSVFYKKYILNLSFIIKLRSHPYIQKINFFFFQNRYLFWCIKNKTIRRYLRVMRYFRQYPNEYWLLMFEVESDEAWITKKNWKRLEWEYWTTKTTYDIMWFKCLNDFGWVYWPKITMFCHFFLIAFFMVIFCLCFIYIKLKISLIYYFLIWFFFFDVEKMLIITDSDAWIIYLGIWTFIWFGLIFLFVQNWNRIYNKAYLNLRKSKLRYWKQDLILNGLNFLIFCFFVFFCLITLCLFWDYAHIISDPLAYVTFYEPYHRSMPWRFYKTRRRKKLKWTALANPLYQPLYFSKRPRHLDERIRADRRIANLMKIYNWDERLIEKINNTIAQTGATPELLDEIKNAKIEQELIKYRIEVINYKAERFMINTWPINIFTFIKHGLAVMPYFHPTRLKKAKIWKKGYFTMYFSLFDYVRISDSIMYSYEKLPLFIDLKSWQIISPFTKLAIYLDIQKNPYLLWNDLFTWYFCFLLFIIAKGLLDDDMDAQLLMEHEFLTPIVTVFTLHFLNIFFPMVLVFIVFSLGFFSLFLILFNTNIDLVEYYYIRPFLMWVMQTIYFKKVFSYYLTVETLFQTLKK